MAELPQPAPTQDGAPINPIRVETALSRYPIHRLSKTGTISIDLQSTDPERADVQWKVSYNAEYGQPGPLAYKVDTLIINRRIDQAPRPLPEVLQLGSLREICRELGLSDHDTDIVKRALHQNASAYITAKIRGSRKGRKQWVELGYTRYTLAFMGDTLPDGRTADAVYIVLNAQHRKILNDIEVRPLDYDYLFQLSPAAQRLYELLSFPMYGALSNDRPRARLKYSDFCRCAPVTRYFEYDPMKKQMSKIHRPHRESGYILKAQFEETVDAEGNRDWEMLYQPGPKALAEFRAFTGRMLAAPAAALLPPPAETPIQAALELTDSAATLCDELVRRGVTQKKARALLAGLKPGQEIMDQLEYVDHILAQAAEGKFRNPSGFYVKFIEENCPVPQGFWSSRKRQQHAQAQQAKESERARRARLQQAYDEHLSQVVQAFIAEQLPAEEFEAMVVRCREQTRRTFRSLTPTQVDELARNMARLELKDSGRVPFPSFEAFCRDALAPA